MAKRAAEDERPAVPLVNNVTRALNHGRQAVGRYRLEELRKDRSSYVHWLPSELVHVVLASYLTDARLVPGHVSRPTKEGSETRTKRYTPLCTHMAMYEPNDRLRFRRHLILPDGTHVIPHKHGFCTFLRTSKQWVVVCMHGDSKVSLSQAIGITPDLRFTFGTDYDVKAWFIGGKLTTESVRRFYHPVPINVCNGALVQRRGGGCWRYAHSCYFPDEKGSAWIYRKDYGDVGYYRCRIMSGTNEVLAKGRLEIGDGSDVRGIVHDASFNVCIVLKGRGMSLGFAWFDAKLLTHIKTLTYDYDDLALTGHLIDSVTVDHKGRISLLAVDLSLVTLE